MGKCCSKQAEEQPRQFNGVENHNALARGNEVIVNNKLFNQDILLRKGMKSGGQFRRIQRSTKH